MKSQQSSILGLMEAANKSSPFVASKRKLIINTDSKDSGVIRLLKTSGRKF